MNPLVSILIPVYNAERFLGKTLQSAVSQTWPVKEIIVVDDGSTDNSLAVAVHFGSAIAKVIREAHQGQTATLNRALKEAQGDYIQYLDADDILTQEKIEIQMKRLISESPDVISTCAWARFYNDDLSTAKFRENADFRDYSSPVDWLIMSWTGQGTMPPVAWLLPRPVVEKAGPWNERLSLNNDTEYFTRIVLNSSKIAFCPEARGYYRSGNPGLSSNRDKAALESFYLVCELCTKELLSFEDSSRARHACASLWQHFVYWTYPDAPKLIRSAELQIESLGGTDLRLPTGGSLHKLLVKIIGWKLAKQAQMKYREIFD